jgi:hypothetical protein
LELDFVSTFDLDSTFVEDLTFAFSDTFDSVFVDDLASLLPESDFVFVEDLYDVFDSVLELVPDDFDFVSVFVELLLSVFVAPA